MSHMDELTPFEKIMEGVNEFATVIRAYYDALINKGFTAEQALALTIEYQKGLLTLLRPK